MRAVVQRVRLASVAVENKSLVSIETGFVVLLGVARGDTDKDAQWMADKIATLRVFSDESKKLQHSITDVGGSVLLISQFTLLADTSKGRRPSFLDAAEPGEAKRLYELCASMVRKNSVTVATGRFGADMQVTLTNDGPLTLLLDSRSSVS